MAVRESTLSSVSRLHERVSKFKRHIAESCEALFSDLENEILECSYELEERSKEVDAKAEQLTQRKTADEQPVEKFRTNSDMSAYRKQSVEKRSIGIQAGQQSASYDARKMYGDLTTGDITHDDVRLAVVEYFGKHRRSFSAIFLGGKSCPRTNAPCHIFQVAYEQAKEYVLHHLVAELMKLFRSKEVDDADNLADRERALKMLLENTSPSPEFQDIAPILSQPHESVEEQTSKVLKKEMYQLFEAITCPDREDKRVWENRKCSFGLLLHITGIKQTQPYDDLKQAVHSELEGYQLNFGALFAEVPILIEESVKIVWDMVTLNPPAISCVPDKFDEASHEKHSTQWEHGRPDHLVYYNPVIFFSFSMDVALKAEVGNKPLRSASTISHGHTRSTRVCTKCHKETKDEGKAVCQNCYEKRALPGLTKCRYCGPKVKSSGRLDSKLTICKQCSSGRLSWCMNCQQKFAVGDNRRQAIGYAWHTNCLKCYYCKNQIQGDTYPDAKNSKIPTCHKCATI